MERILEAPEPTVLYDYKVSFVTAQNLQRARFLKAADATDAAGQFEQFAVDRYPGAKVIDIRKKRRPATPEINQHASIGDYVSELLGVRN